MNDLRVVTLAGDPDREAGLASELDGRRDVELVLRCVDRVELLGALRSGAVDAIVSVGAPTWFEKQEAFEASQAGIVVVGVVRDPLDADRLAELGAGLLPTEASVQEIIDRCRSSEPLPTPVQAGYHSNGDRGRLVAVWGPKGAPGRTRVSIELAAELAVAESSTLLIDGDPYGGDVVQMLGIVEELPSVLWAARLAARGQLDNIRLAADLRRAGPRGPVVLPGIPRAELWPDVSEFGWRALLEVATSSFRYAVCDVGFCIETAASPYPGSGEGRNRMAVETLRAADAVVAVCRADPVGLKNFVWTFEHLRELVDDDCIRIVANRVRRSEEGQVGDVLRKHVGRRPVAYIPDIPSQIHRALLLGRSLREAGLSLGGAGSIESLAASLGGRLPSRGLLARLSGRA
jgi:MinD-like ATPase involved in chromosome partitioning or flagellar assembly